MLQYSSMNKLVSDALSKDNNSIYNPKTYPEILAGDKVESILGYDFPILTWPEIEARFRHKCIIYTNYEIVKDDRDVICTVVSVCDEDNSFDEVKRFYALGIKTAQSYTGLPERGY